MLEWQSCRVPFLLLQTFARKVFDAKFAYFGTRTPSSRKHTDLVPSFYPYSCRHLLKSHCSPKVNTTFLPTNYVIPGKLIFSVMFVILVSGGGGVLMSWCTGTGPCAIPLPLGNDQLGRICWNGLTTPAHPALLQVCENLSLIKTPLWKKTHVYFK